MNEFWKTIQNYTIVKYSIHSILILRKSHNFKNILKYNILDMELHVTAQGVCSMITIGLIASWIVHYFW